MARTAHAGEFHDDAIYTHQRIATLLGRDPEWVVENLLLPREPETRGVPHRKIGSLYFITGENFRLWIERHSQ